MISHQKKFIFVHIPKTAGSSIEAVLSQYSEDKLMPCAEGVEYFRLISATAPKLHKHAPLRRYRRYLPPETYKSYYKFTCVRNPWDRLISAYFAPGKGNEHWDRQTFIELVQSRKQMVTYLDSRKLPNVLERFIRPRVDTDMVVRYESLHEDFGAVCQRLDIPMPDLPRRNKSARGHYSEYYDQELIDLVARRFAADIRLFGYKFESAPVAQHDDQ